MKTEQTYGAVIIYKENRENKFLLLQHNDDEGSWSFPKGHQEEGESREQTARREIFEETGILVSSFLDVPLIHEERYIIKRNAIKINDYFIAFVDNMNVKIQESEIHQYKWCTFEEALATFQYESRKELLKKAKEYLDNYEG